MKPDSKLGGIIRMWLWLMLGAGAAVVPALAAELRPFTAKSLAEIREANAGRAFVLAFWSINCAPCKEEMGLFAKLHRQHPGVPIVLVATDPPTERKAIDRFLARYELGRIGTWIFADEFVERVRFSVDRSWRGELPRTYFFDAGHTAAPQSGVLEPGWVEAWFARESAARRR